MKIGYARVSSTDQNLERQIEALDQAGCKLIFKEKLSGKNADRPELKTMIEAAQEGDVVVVLKLDRLGRSLMDLFTIVEALRDKGVGFMSLSETIDTTSPQGKFMFSMLGAFAEFERAMILERTNGGIRHQKANGIYKGGRKPKIDRAAFEQDHRAGMSVSDLAAKYKVNRMTVWRNVKRLGMCPITPHEDLTTSYLKIISSIPPSHPEL